MVKSFDKKMLMYILLAFIFSVGVRMIWVYQFSSVDDFFWNGHLMINTNDGYYYAEGARDALKGAHEANDFSPIDSPTSLLTAFFAKILPFSFESVILYLPAFLSSLIVIPLILIGKRLKNAEVGFIAALLGSIAWSYYNRTMAGYYDTDMLNIVFPMFVLYFFILSIQEKSLHFAFIGSVSILIYSWWYIASYSLMSAFIALLFVYCILSIFLSKRAEKKQKLCEHLQKCKNLGFIHDDYLYFYKLLILAFIASSFLHVGLKLIVLFILYILFFKKDFNEKIIFIMFLCSLVLFLGSGVLESVLSQLGSYVFRDEVLEIGGDIKLFFFTSHQTVREASAIPFDEFANRISGNIILFFVSLIGYMYLCFKHRIVLLSLPMVALGFIAYKSGLRFTVYAVPWMALGFGYLLIKLSELLDNKVAKYAFVSIFTLIALAPNILHVKDYRVPTVFNKYEVGSIDKLKKIASREDYVLSWWDYGYPLRYYGDIKTLVDGGASKSRSKLFQASFILGSDQKSAANLSRLAVEYREKEFKALKNKEKIPSNNLSWMMKDYEYKNSNDFLSSLQDDIKLPEKTRDIYLYLPYRMAGIFPTISKFSYRNLMDGKEKKQPFFYQATALKDVGDKIFLGSGISIDKKRSIINIGKNKIPLKSFYRLGYNKNNRIIINKQTANPNGYLSIVYAKPYGTMFVLDDNMLNSTYVQLFFFENYNKNLFELISSNPYTKIYKLKK